MKIFKSEVLPFYDEFVKSVRWERKDNWGVEIDGTRYYGFWSWEDCGKALRKKFYGYS